MPRHNRSRREPPRSLAHLQQLGQQTEAHPDGDWVVRQVRGNDSGRWYVCPGCQQRLPASVAHTVAWPDHGMGTIDDRRHWHTGCWRARGRRAPRGAWR